MNRIVRALLNYMIRGALVIVPIAAAIFLIYWIFVKVDSALNISDVIWVDQAGKPIYIPGLGILTVLLVLIVVGIVVTNFVTDPIKKWFARWFKRLPVFNVIYTSFKDLTEAFVGDDKKFSEPVVVEVNETGLKKIGFITQKDLTKIGYPGDVAVYFPLSYSFAGQLCFVNMERVKPLNMSASEAMKFIVSGGVSHL
ncbi:DUF502 domain-containing protein [Daejeonella lutea]|uniref:Uncharacterized membrane protein n=1 Tax=Daejeonella lutea TaxID=572036 RepID=A0A1T5ARA7_9SPHI|nr:DUF502 domain-containing protein [Daejeonella lutea]SKB37415.1 Uncharacterized membrane protein [Daejeonella lutea]